MPKIVIKAGYIKCRADEVGFREYEVTLPDFTEPVTVIAASRNDADRELELQRSEVIRCFPKIKRITMQSCPHCNGIGEVEV